VPQHLASHISGSAGCLGAVVVKDGALVLGEVLALDQNAMTGLNVATRPGQPGFVLTNSDFAGVILRLPGMATASNGEISNVPFEPVWAQ